MRLVTFAAAVLLAAAVAAQPADDKPIAFNADAVVWSPGPPSLPPGSKMAVLEGSPRAEGMFTMRVRIPAGSAIAPHWHPRHERVTILSGAVDLGFGSVADAANTKRYGAGSFYVNPPRVMHFLFFPEETVMQMTGIGPWELHTEDIAAATPAPATAIVTIRSIVPPRASVLKSGGTLTITADYEIAGFRPQTFFTMLAMESTKPHVSVGPTVRARHSGGGVPAPPRLHMLTEARGTFTITEEVDNLLATRDVKLPLRVKVNVNELTGELTSRVAGESVWIDFR